MSAMSVPRQCPDFKPCSRRTSNSANPSVDHVFSQCNSGLCWRGIPDYVALCPRSSCRSHSCLTTNPIQTSNRKRIQPVSKIAQNSQQLNIKILVVLTWQVWIVGNHSVPSLINVTTSPTISQSPTKSYLSLCHREERRTSNLPFVSVAVAPSVRPEPLLSL